MARKKDDESRSNFLKRIAQSIINRQGRRESINRADRERLKNTSPSVVASNCMGAVMSHDLGLRFNSQFVNLYLEPHDFVKYMSRFDYYNAIDEITFLPDSEKVGVTYPVGKIEDLTIFFVHYHSDEEAQRVWNERKKRLDPENMFVMMNETATSTKEDLIAFDQLPFKNKVVFTKNDYPDIASAFCIGKDFFDVGVFGFANSLTAHRFIDAFPYVEWLNGEYKNGTEHE